jgi:hypothetical protein
MIYWQLGIRDRSMCNESDVSERAVANPETIQKRGSRRSVVMSARLLTRTSGLPVTRLVFLEQFQKIFTGDECEPTGQYGLDGNRVTRTSQYGIKSQLGSRQFAVTGAKRGQR